MIGGLLVDVMVVAAIVAFGWAGMQLGGRRSAARLIAAYAAFGLAALLRDAVGSFVEAALGTSDDFARLVAMVLVGVGGYLAVMSIVEWWLRRRTATRHRSEMDGFGADETDPLDDSRLAALAGGLLGAAWVLAFVVMLVMLPVDSPIARAAISSNTGGMLIAQERVLRWTSRGFPHYTQTLPKGEDGAVVGEHDELPMRGGDAPTSRPGDVDVLLNAVNDVRRNRRVRTLVFNPDVAAVARRQALELAADQSLSYRSPGGGTLDARVRAALGETSGSFAEDVGIEVVWAHSPANAGAGLLADDRAAMLVRDDSWSELGIGAADAGWFDGRVYVLLLVGPAEAEADGGSLPEGQTNEGDLGAAAAAGTLPADDADPDGVISGGAQTP